MSIFKLLFPAPTKEKTLEDLAYWRARVKVAIEHEKMKRHIDGYLLGRIEKMKGTIARLEARLETFN